MFYVLSVASFRLVEDYDYYGVAISRLKNETTTCGFY